MKRLTKKDFNICNICDRGPLGMNWDCDGFPACGEKAAYDRLAAYEDTGLEPEEIKSLIAEWDTNLKTLNAYRSRFSAVIAPMRYGYWMDSSNGWTCSECYSDNIRDTKWCPNCGAKMDRKVPEE